MTIMDELKCYVARLSITNRTDDYAKPYLPLRNSYLIAASVLSALSSYSRYTLKQIRLFTGEYRQSKRIILNKTKNIKSTALHRLIVWKYKTQRTVIAVRWKVPMGTYGDWANNVETLTQTTILGAAKPAPSVHVPKHITLYAVRRNN